MRPFSRFLLGAAAVAALGGAALAADRTHVLNVALPDGSVAHVRYVGDVPPRLVLAQPAPAMALPIGLFGLGGDSPFAMLDRMAAEMDRQTSAMMQQGAALATAVPATAGRVEPSATGALPAGTMSYTMVSYSSGAGGTCSQSVRVTALRPGAAPEVVRQSAGDCRAMATRAPVPAVERAAPAAGTPAITEARYVAPAAKPKPAPTI